MRLLAFTSGLIIALFLAPPLAVIILLTGLVVLFRRERGPAIDPFDPYAD